MVALLLMVLSAMGVSRAVAQNGDIRSMLIIDSLTPAKRQLRDSVAKLRDSLVVVQSIHDRILRARTASMPSVVLSSARQLGRRCHMVIDLANSTYHYVASIHSNSQIGEEALARYRLALANLQNDLRSCVHEDSVVMANRTPDPDRIQQVASAASDAVRRYDQDRDAFLRTLGIDLPVKGYIPPRKG